ncbi:hypothetical protein [Mycobacterium tuberculosis]|uniref:hypothetical protein n=2 Tax=Mycobacterium tuberculosis TaxID=1773 RepID=UPI001F288976|nr:hypothetical protein [Mycobacterium tuberculosis]
MTVLGLMDVAMVTLVGERRPDLGFGQVQVQLPAFGHDFAERTIDALGHRVGVCRERTALPWPQNECQIQCGEEAFGMHRLDLVRLQQEAGRGIPVPDSTMILGMSEALGGRMLLDVLS